MNFRHQSFRHQSLIKLAESVSDFVSRELNQKQEAPSKTATKPISYQKTIKLKDATADIPANPFGPNGEVNFMFVFRYVKDTRKNAGIAGVNTVVVYSDIGKKYEDPKYISNTISAILYELRKTNPNAKLGKYGLTGFSGGYFPIESILARKKQLVADVGKEPDAIILADAGHTVPAAMKPFIEYAREAATPGSGKKFVTVHSAIPAGGSAGPTSTTMHTQMMLDELGLSRGQVSPEDARFAEWSQGIKPKSVATQNGFTAIQADDDPKRRWEAGNGEGTSGWVHMQIARTIPLIWQNTLQDWNY